MAALRHPEVKEVVASILARRVAMEVSERTLTLNRRTQTGPAFSGRADGLDVFGLGGEALHNTIRHVLLLANDLLNRPVSAQILKAHLANRRKEPPLI